MSGSAGPVCLWSACAGCTPAVRAGDPTAARRWVEQAMADPHAAQRLRHVAADLPEAAQPLRHDAAALVGALAAALVSGTIRACGAARPVTLYKPGELPQAAPAAAPPPAAARRAAAAAAAASPGAAEGTFDAALDTAAMVEALQQAARDGVPFCEECERERQQAEAA
jgi:hypothetical protein